MIKIILFSLIEGFLRNISGSVGRKLRYFYYKNRFASCGKNIYIDEGVVFEKPEYMYIDDNVKKINKRYIRINKNIEEGILSIGSNSHIGISTIIQAHAGVKIGEYFTSSAGCKVYSLSNDYKKTKSGVMDNSFYIASPIEIKRNVWLGLNSIVLGGVIEEDVFVAPNSVVVNDMKKNSFASSNPAKK